MKKKMKINDPADFSRFKPFDLTCLGMTGNEINRLVNQLIEDGYPVGNLLSDRHMDCGYLSSDIDSHNVTDFHRSKLLRKLFGKKQSLFTSAPVSPAHRPEYRSIERLPIQRPQQQVPYRSTSFTDDRKSNPVQNTSDSTPTNPTAFTCLIPEKDIKLHSKIGIGSFGIVRRGDWTMPTGETIPVAVKLLRSEAMKSDIFTGFLYEVRAMQCLSHPSLIRLHGIVLSNPIMMVTELAPLGSLLLHLRAQSMCARNNSCQTNSPNNLPYVPRALQIDSLWDMGIQISRGMAYLSSQGLVHRDLAARNILLSSIQKNEYPQIKIADFGLVRSVVDSTNITDKKLNKENEFNEPVYTGNLEQKIPFAWSAPESLRKRVFSEASDVWSLGVTFWEMWTGGADPWPGVNAGQLLELLDSGRRLVWPRYTCPRRLYQLMLACWRAEPYRRPTFSYLSERLDQIRPITVVATQNLDEADRLGLEAGDTVIVIDGKSHKFWWSGQNKRTGEIGLFPRGIVQRGNSDTLTNEDISRPIRDSFLHAEHIRKNGTGWSSSQPGVSNEIFHHHMHGLNASPSVRSAHTEAKCNLRKTEKVSNSVEYNLLPLDDNDWLPVQNSSLADLENASISHHTTDSYSFYGCMLNNAASVHAPCLETYDDNGGGGGDGDEEEEEDERRRLDRLPDSTVGLNAYNVELRKCSNSKLLNNHRNSVANCEGNFYNSDTYTYQSLTMLPPPPGPEDSETVVTEDKSNEAFTDLIQLTKPRNSSLRIPPPNSENNQTRLESNSKIDQKTENSLPPSSSLSSNSETTIHSKQSFSLDNLLDEINSVGDNDGNKCQPSAPPLIDLYSRVPDPLVFTPRYRITVPTAPIYTPSVMKPTHPYYSGVFPRATAPVYSSNPFLVMNSNISTQFACCTQGQYFPNPFYHQQQGYAQKSYGGTTDPFSSSSSSSTKFNMNHSVTQMTSGSSGDNPFDLNNLKSKPHSSSTDEIGTVKKQNNNDPLNIFDFTFDTINNSNNNPNKNDVATTSCNDKQSVVVSCAKPTVGNSMFSSKQPVHPPTRLENELLVRSCSGTNFSSSSSSVPTIPDPCSIDLSRTKAQPVNSSVGMPVQSDTISDVQPQIQESENHPKLSNSVDIFTDEISLVCSQVPGCTSSEAHWALLHVMNPFSPIIPQLIVPPIPHTSPIETWRTRLDRTSAWRVQLAVRLLSVCRLYQLGLINWDSCCEIISAFNWQLEPAADWILDHMTPSCFI
ncbi:unnamed protein product [Trichobilharzia szidati]|nr:unnamed protein product [Trichobilharzia szidati]